MHKIVGTAIRRPRQEQDLVLWINDNERNYCCTIIEYPNATSADIEVPVGKVVDNAHTILADFATPAALQPTFDNGIVLKRTIVPPGGADVEVLVRGPAILNFNEVERASANESDAALTTRLSVLVSQGIRFTKHPPVTSTPDLDS